MKHHQPAAIRARAQRRPRRHAEHQRGQDQRQPMVQVAAERLEREQQDHFDRHQRKAADPQRPRSDPARPPAARRPRHARRRQRGAGGAPRPARLGEARRECRCAGMVRAQPIGAHVGASDRPLVAVDLRRPVGRKRRAHLSDAVGRQPLRDGRRHREIVPQPARRAAGDPFLRRRRRRDVGREIQNIVIRQDRRRREFRAQRPFERCAQVFEFGSQVIRRKQQPHRQQAARRQLPPRRAEEFARVEAVEKRRAGRGQIDQHRVVRRRGRIRRALREEPAPVAALDVHARIVQRRAAGRRGMFARQRDQLGIEFDVVHPFRRVLQNFAQHAVESVSDQQDAFRRRMGQQGKMREGLAGLRFVFRAEQQAVLEVRQLAVGRDDGQMAVDRPARFDEELAGKPPRIRPSLQARRFQPRRRDRGQRQQQHQPERRRAVAKPGAEREPRQHVQAAQPTDDAEFVRDGEPCREQSAPDREPERFQRVGAPRRPLRVRPRAPRPQPQRELRAQREPQRRQPDEGEGRGGAQIRRRAGHRPQQRPAAAHRDQQRRQQRRRARMAHDQRPMARSRPGAEPPARPRAEPRPEQPREQRPPNEKLVAAERDQQLADQQHLRHDRGDAQRQVRKCQRLLHAPILAGFSTEWKRFAAIFHGVEKVSAGARAAPKRRGNRPVSRDDAGCPRSPAAARRPRSSALRPRPRSAPGARGNGRRRRRRPRRTAPGRSTRRTGAGPSRN